MDTCNVSLQILPSVEDSRLYEVVDKVIEYIESTGVKFEVGLWKLPWKEKLMIY